MPRERVFLPLFLLTLAGAAAIGVLIWGLTSAGAHPLAAWTAVPAVVVMTAALLYADRSPADAEEGPGLGERRARTGVVVMGGIAIYHYAGLMFRRSPLSPDDAVATVAATTLVILIAAWTVLWLATSHRVRRRVDERDELIELRATANGHGVFLSFIVLDLLVAVAFPSWGDPTSTALDTMRSLARLVMIAFLFEHGMALFMHRRDRLGEE